MSGKERTSKEACTTPHTPDVLPASRMRHRGWTETAPLLSLGLSARKERARRSFTGEMGSGLSRQGHGAARAVTGAGDSASYIIFLLSPDPAVTCHPTSGVANTRPRTFTEASRARNGML